MRRGRRGSSFVETAIFLPFLLLLTAGMAQFGRITYVYYSLKKSLWAAGTYLAGQQGVNFCGESDAAIEAAKAFALTGAPENLTAEMIRVEPECVDPATGEVGPCPMDGCGTAAGGPRPAFLVVSIPGGYAVLPRLPYMQADPIALRPEVRIPFGGT